MERALDDFIGTLMDGVQNKTADFYATANGAQHTAHDALLRFIQWNRLHISSVSYISG